MNLKNNANGNGRLTPLVRIVLLVVAAILIVFLLYRQVDRLRGPRRTVWVPSADLDAGAVIEADDLDSRSIRERRLPQDAVAERQTIQGRQLARSKTAGAPFVAGDFAAAGSDPGSITRLVPEGRVLMTVRIEARAMPFPELRRGDRLNILAVPPGGGSGGSVAIDAYFLGWIQPQSPNSAKEKGTILGIDIRPPGRSGNDDTVSLLLALHPEHVLPLARAEAAGSKLNFVLHGRNEVQDGELLVLPMNRGPRSIEVISGSRRRNVDFEQ